MMHDGWHFTGVPCMTRRYAWGWYTLAKDAHVNLVRPHAMPYPRYFYDMADEMGMLIMDESAIFGSHCNFNYDSEKLLGAQPRACRSGWCAATAIIPRSWAGAWPTRSGACS
jgi:hypothetical protein